jgi:outer membrane lipoprotein-sorting protein
MKQFAIFILLFNYLYVFSQQDPEAKTILDRVAEKNRNCSTIQADFELVVENHRDNKTSRSTGSVKIKGNKYYIESMGSKVFFDGKTLWSFMEDLNEVNISSPDTAQDDFMENPVKIFGFYNHNFKYRLVSEVRIDEGWMYEIDLFPNDLNQPYSRFKLLVNRDTDDIYKITAVGKDGIDYCAYIRNAIYNQSLNDEVFIFKPEKHKGIEIIDMR